FQPAEEGRNGAKAMIDDGLFEKFPVESVYGMHNMPGFDAGKILVRSGPMMASADFVRIRIQGKGGHAAFPHQTVDPVLIAAQLIQAIQGIVARNVDPLEAGVVTIAMIHGGHARNIIPDDVELQGTARAFSTKMQELIQDRLQKLCDGIAAAHGAKIELHYERLYPPTVNTEDETKEAAAAAAEVVGRENVQWNPPPAMGAEDFAWMLREKPGSYVWIGNGAGEGGCMLHNPHYDFNDDILPVGASYWVALTERLLKVD
ncbi:MAG: amidohydrolase, partial [Alphaproteobacteria bacterium]